ncbi:hypothetical protein ABT352_33115 [Streptosporangium sp. NPDC000563]
MSAAAIAILATQTDQDLEDFASFLTPAQQTVFWEQIADARA